MRTRDMHPGRLVLAAVLFSGMAVLSARAQPKKDVPPKSPAAIKLPSGAIVIVTDKLGETIQKTDAVYLTPEKYQEMREQIDRLQKQVAAEKPNAPSACELEGRVEQRGGQAIVRLKATFRFKTLVPRSVVHLGCQKAQLTDAGIDDGKLPLLVPGENGLSVLVESAAEHTLRLELEAPLAARSGKAGEIGFEIGLPGAPITTLSFHAPANVKRVVIGRREAGSLLVSGVLETKRVAVEALAPGNGGQALGPVTHLELAWEDPSQPAPAAAARSAEADISVNVSETEVQTEARLLLKGSSKDWRFLAPATAEVVVGKAPPPGSDPAAKPIELPLDQAPTISRPDPNQPPIWRLQFREPNAAELLVTVLSRSPRPRAVDAKTARGTFPVGPIAALDVPRQTGNIRVKTPPNLRATPLLKGDTRRQDGGEDPNADVVYRYTTLPPGANNLPATPLELDVRIVPGVLQTRVAHYLQLAEGGWRLKAEVQVTPIRAEAERLEFEVPAELQNIVVSPPELVEGVLPTRDSGPQRRIVPVKLAGMRRAPFTLNFEALYPLPANARSAGLVLPRLLGAFDRGGEINVAVPEGFDLRAGAREWDGDKPGGLAQPLEMGANGLHLALPRPVAQADLIWRTHLPDVRVDAVLDLTLGEAQGRIAQQVRVASSGGLRKLKLRGPANVLNLGVSPGSLESTAPGEWLLALPTTFGRDDTVRLSYAFNLPPRTAARSDVPLIWIEGAAQTETRVRVWRDASAPGRPLPVGVEPPWQEVPAEVIAERDTLPVLVIQAGGDRLPLALRFAEVEESTLVQTWIDQSLIQVQASESVQRWRARFHVRKWSDAALELQLPALAGEIESLVNGKPVEAREVGERVLRVPLPAWRAGRSAMVDVRFQLPAGGNRLVLVPPLPRGRVSIAVSRWQVALPPRTTPLYFGTAAAIEERWGWPGGLPAPMPARSVAELEAWLATGQEPLPESGGLNMGDGPLSARQGGLEPLRLLVVPQATCPIAASLVVFLGGLVISRLRSRDAWALTLLALAVAGIGAFFWTQPAWHFLAGALPGVALLVVVLGLLQFLSWRWRWRVANMPAFSRGAAASAVSRTSNVRPMPKREASTIDAPQPDQWASSSSSSSS